MTESTLNNEELQKEIISGRPVELRGYTFTESFQNNLETMLYYCLDAYSKSALLPTVFTVIQELALWGSLANMRQIYFEENNLDLNDPDVLQRNEPLFQQTVKFDNIRSYKGRVREKNLFLNIRINHNLAGLRIEVMNNAVHSKPLEEKLRRQLRQAMNYTDVMDYFKDNPDDKEGRGMGLAFSLLMLKEENLRPELMRMGAAGDTLTSRLEIPFDATFQSIRDRIMNDEVIMPFEQRSLVPEGMELKLAPERTRPCPVCGAEVDEKVFFSVAADDIADVELIKKIKPDWQPDHGACASCIAIYSNE